MSGRTFREQPRQPVILQPPDFAIVGAPKCGTTALFSYLSTHPGIAMSARKEPFFWSPDIPRGGRISDKAAYHALWANAASGALRGEASTEYLRSRLAIPGLLAIRPDIRLLAMIRNPVEMVASRHSNLVFGFQEDVRDLELAWRLQEPRRRGESMPPRCTEPGSLQYFESASIGDQLERFVATVPAGQSLVVLYDDFRADTRAEYRRVLDFLGLPDDGRDDFTPVHANLVLRSARLANLHRSVSRGLGPLGDPVRTVAHAVGLRPFAWIARLNVHSTPRKPLRREFEEELIAAFHPQIEKVERLLGRDLADWRVPESRAEWAA